MQLPDSQYAEPLTFNHRGHTYTVNLREATEEDVREAEKSKFNTKRSLFRFFIKRLFISGDAEVLAQNELLDKAAYSFRLLVESVRKPA